MSSRHAGSHPQSAGGAIPAKPYSTSSRSETKASKNLISLADPDVLTQEIVEDLEAAPDNWVSHFRSVIVCRQGFTAMKEQLTAVFQKVPEGYIAFVEKLPGANAQGRYSGGSHV